MTIFDYAAIGALTFLGLWVVAGLLGRNKFKL